MPQSHEYYLWPFDLHFSLNLINILNCLCLYVKYTIGKLNSLFLLVKWKLAFHSIWLLCHLSTDSLKYLGEPVIRQFAILVPKYSRLVRSVSWSTSKKLENPFKRYFVPENISRIKYVFQENLISHLMDNSKTKCLNSWKWGLSLKLNDL